LSRSVGPLTLDEPPPALNGNDSQSLLQLLRDFRAQGIACVLISHKLKEVESVADTITVLRDGAVIETLDAKTGDVTEDRLEVLRNADAVVVEEIKAAGAWVFGGGLHPAELATVVKVKDGDVVTTDGPFAESKEHIGGFWIIKAVDLDAALAWAAKATVACRAPVEVRPFQSE